MSDLSMLINGLKVTAENNATFERRNPLDGSVATRAPACSPADAVLAVVRDGLGDGRTLAELEIFTGRLLEGRPVGVRLLPARHLGMGVDVDGDEIVDLHGVSPAR